MEDKKIKEFNKIYLDTIQHSKNIKKWIDSSSRKKGDLNKSMQRLENKYNKLFVLKKQLEKDGISDKTLLSQTSRNNSIDDYKTLIKDIKELYSLTKTEVPSKLIQEERKLSTPQITIVNAKREIDYTGDIEDERAKYYQNEYIYYSGYYQKPPLIYRFKRYLGNFVDKTKDFLEKSRKAVVRVTSIVLVSAIALAGGITAGESNSEANDKDSNSISYTTTTKDSNTKNIIETTYTEFISPNKATPDSITPTNTIENCTESVKETVNKQEPTEDIKEETPKQAVKNDSKTQSEKEFEIGNGTYLVKANTKYTEVSDGSGNWGIFSKDTKVKVYNRALVRTDKNGNKQILEATRPGQTWEQFAEEHDINYSDFKNYIENNNIEKCVSLDSEDGNSSYGWVSENVVFSTAEKEMDMSR